MFHHQEGWGPGVARRGGLSMGVLGVQRAAAGFAWGRDVMQHRNDPLAWCRTDGQTVAAASSEQGVVAVCRTGGRRVGSVMHEAGGGSHRPARVLAMSGSRRRLRS
jgi:hypothetical protein